MRRLVRGLAALVLGAAALLLLLPTPAGAAVVAAPFDCTEAPTPEVPGRGLTGFFQAEPKQLPPEENPFTPNAKTTIYEQYGYAGLRWTTYDLGCGPDSARSPDAVAGTAMANWLYLLPKVGVAFTNAVVEVAFQPTFLGVFDPLVRNVSDVLYRTLFSVWVPLVLIATGFLLIWRARRANLASSTAAVGWAVLVLLITTALFRWPVEAGHTADASVTTTLGAVNRDLGGNTPDGKTTSQQTAASLHESILYNSWLGGTFGQTNSDTAKLYGPELFDATALTWREARIMREDPARGKEIIEQKRDKFSEVAGKIKDADPDAYEYVTGKRSETRVGYAMLALFGALCALPFLFLASLIVLGAFLIFRFAVMLFPAFATLGAFPSMRGIVTSVGNTVAAALLNAILFGVAAAVTLRGIMLLLDPDSPLPPWLALTLMLLFSVVMWFATRPVRRLRTIVYSRKASIEEASTTDEPAQTRGRRRARHARREDRRAAEDDMPDARAEMRSEVHTVTEAESSAELPDTFRFDFPQTTSPGPVTAPAVAAGGGATRLGTGRAAPSPNGHGPAPHEARPMDDLARDFNAEPARRSDAPGEASPSASPGSPGRRPLGGDGASAPLTTRAAVDESAGGATYVPDRTRLPNGNGTPADPNRMRLEEFAGPVYRPKGTGRAPGRTGE